MSAGPSDWNDPLDPIVVTVEEVASGQSAVVRVVHEEGHGGWQFYDSIPAAGRQPVIVPKAEIIAHDGSLHAVTDLPVGWQAKRLAPGMPWERTPLSSS